MPHWRNGWRASKAAGAGLKILCLSMIFLFEHDLFRKTGSHFSGSCTLFEHDFSGKRFAFVLRENRFPPCASAALRVRAMLYAGAGHSIIDRVLVAAS